MRNSIFAFTASGTCYPEFISVNIEDGKVSVIVRSKADGSNCGSTAEIELGPKEVRELARTLYGFACTTNA